jgi:hypothetical protein
MAQLRVIALGQLLNENSHKIAQLYFFNRFILFACFTRVKSRKDETHKSTKDNNLKSINPGKRRSQQFCRKED